jgi:plasmid stabilization system protein ParE
MDFQVILMPMALKDLEEITRHIAKDDAGVAERFGNKLIDRTLSLATFPKRGRVVPEFDDPTLREIIQGALSNPLPRAARSSSNPRPSLLACRPRRAFYLTR